MTDLTHTPSLLKTRLSIMMFLQYAIWGAWLPLLWPFLADHRGFNGDEIGWMFAIGAVGALVAPFIAGQIADRFFSTQKFLGISHIVGGVLVWQLANLETFGSFLLFSLLYSLIYSPTLPLTNSLSFHHLPDRDRDFGKVRVWGTVGWIVVGIMIGQWLLHSHTITNEEATQKVVAEEFADADVRARLLSYSVIEAKDEEGEDIELTGLIIDITSEQLSIDVPTMNDDDEEVMENHVFDRSDVPTITPLYETLAAEGKANDVLLAINALNADDSELTQENVATTLSTAEALNSIALKDPIDAGQKAGMADAFRLSAIIGLIMGLFCFTLPSTPPSKGSESNATFEALSEVKYNPLLMLFLIAVPISCIHQFYFVHTAGFLGQFQTAEASINTIFGVGGGGLMTVGQMSEILVLAAIPLVAKSLSRKSLLAIGVLAYAVRMALFSYCEPIAATTGIPAIAIAIAGVSMHGFCFGCFIFVAFMVVDEETTPDVRASAQSLFNLVIVGIGIIVGSKVAGWVAVWATNANDELEYTKLFGIPMWASLGCLVLLLLGYPRKGRRASLEAAAQDE